MRIVRMQMSNCCPMMSLIAHADYAFCERQAFELSLEMKRTIRSFKLGRQWQLEQFASIQLYLQLYGGKVTIVFWLGCCVILRFTWTTTSADISRKKFFNLFEQLFFQRPRIMTKVFRVNLHTAYMALTINSPWRRNLLFTRLFLKPVFRQSYFRKPKYFSLSELVEMLSRKFIHISKLSLDWY